MAARYRIDLDQIAWQLIVDIALERQTNIRKDLYAKFYNGEGPYNKLAVRHYANQPACQL